ncbi:GerMN domain-containing protein [Candidatus Hakubella thermalkaliphila]|nr:GerMN domain-containing protein [Candidatus Hakubella thermalkaliphila]
MSTKRVEQKRSAAFSIAFLIVVLVLVVLLLTGCAGEKGTVAGPGREGETPEAAGPEVTITLYFSRWTETEAYLVAEKREVAVHENLPLVALQGLIKGPATDDLLPTLPSTTTVLSLEIENGLCTVNFSKEILFDAYQVGPSATGEALALGSIANTLTEFPQIQEVKILIEGKSEGEVDRWPVENFWGHVGIYESLTRDESIIGPPFEPDDQPLQI